MSSKNRIDIIGNLGADPENRTKGEGNTVVTFSVATTEKWTGKDGQKHEATDWHDVAVFGKLGEICLKYLKKGSRVSVEGKLRYRNWVKDDQNHKSASIHAHEVLFLNTAPRAEEIPAGDNQPAAEDDLPF